MTEISQNELIKKMDGKKPPIVIDVRFRLEYNNAHIKNAVHIPFYAIFWNKKRLPNDKSAVLILTCEHGPRAVMARRLLWITGYRNVRLLKGHMVEWKKNQLPIIS